jgi:hypothetical protein
MDNLQGFESIDQPMHAMTLMTDLKVTTDILWKGAIYFAIIDIVFVTMVTRLIKPADFQKMKWKLAAVMAIYFCALFGFVASYLFWDAAYSYVFPAWARWIMPPVYGLLFASYGLFVWWLSIRLRTNPVLNFCFFGGLWGIITHVWAIYRGILDKPPMLQGADPVAALVIAAFEFIFYWCICLMLAFLIQRFGKRKLDHGVTRLFPGK